MSGTIITGAGIPVFTLMAQRAAIRLEALGMKHSSGRSATAHVKRTLGIKGNHAAVIDELTKRINAAKENSEVVKGFQPIGGDDAAH